MKLAVQLLEPNKRPIPRHALPCPSPFCNNVEAPPLGKLSAVGVGSITAVGAIVGATVGALVGVMASAAVSVGEGTDGWLQATKRNEIKSSGKAYFIFIIGVVFLLGLQYHSRNIILLWVQETLYRQ